MFTHIFTGSFNLLPTLRDTTVGGPPVILDKIRKQEQQSFLLLKLPCPFHDYLMERTQVADCLLIMDNIF